jgi:hypothetical protein
MRRFQNVVTVALLFATAVAAQSSRLETSADRLARAAQGVAEDAYREFADRARGNPADVEALYLAVQFEAGAALFRRMVQDRRPESELRPALELLQSQIRTAERLSFRRSDWRDMAATLDETERELRGGGRRRWEDSQPAGRVGGTLRWRGAVDQEVQILVRGSNASSRTLAGAPVRNPTANFTSPLPSRRTTVELRPIRGRGAVELVQQPSRDNDFTAVVRILDNKGGADDYEFELVW